MENVGLCSAPSVNTAIPHYNQFEIKSSNFNFSSEKQKFYQSVSFTSAGYAAIWLIQNKLKPILTNLSNSKQILL
jgi:hypothetical protein